MHEASVLLVAPCWTGLNFICAQFDYALGRLWVSACLVQMR